MSALNSLAMLRFGFHGAGGGFGLFLFGLVLIIGLVWALNSKNNSTT
jgi:O-antigen/teichoic acid export membrane protein